MIPFILISLATLAAAIMVIRSEKLIYSTLWLAGLFVGVAGLFLTLGAELLAMIQILIYAGAIVTLILFAIMFTERTPPETEDEDERR
ncbi:MAG: NADH-quinone oxidoreductase subunit J [Candidatus Bipolaricaulia bacterium]